MREKHEMRVNYAWVFLVIFVLTVWLAYEKYISCLFRGVFHDRNVENGNKLKQDYPLNLFIDS